MSASSRRASRSTSRCPAGAHPPKASVSSIDCRRRRATTSRSWKKSPASAPRSSRPVPSATTQLFATRSGDEYAIMSHGHGDHDGGAKYLQDRFKTRIIMGEPDWELTSRNSRDPVPQKDLIATDGQKVTLGGQTVTLYLTPGHTAGTVSTLIPVTDGGRPHVAAEWGGTAFSATTPAEQLRTYISSAQRFRDVAPRAGADVIITNHTAFDATLAKLDALKNRKPGAPHPYVLGTEGVKRYLTVAEECAKSALAAKP